MDTASSEGTAQAITLAAGLCRQFEGLRLSSYQDPVGIWTIGYGATGPNIVAGLQWTQDQAEADLLNRLNTLDAELQKDIPLWSSLPPQEKAAILDWTYNLGLKRLLGSTLGDYIEHGQLSGVPEQIAKWVYAGGHILAGLVARRAAEAALWNQASSQVNSTSN